MKLTQTLIPATIILLFTALVFTDCSKQRIAQNEYEEPYEWMNDNKPEEQEFVLDTGGSGPIIGNQGTHLYMDSSIFMFPGGGDVSYPIIIKLIEVYQPGDMMLYQLPTISNGQLLTTGGEIRVRAFKDGVELVLKPNKVYRAKAPTQNQDPAMGMFFGEEDGEMVLWHDNPSTVSSSPNVDALESVSLDTAAFYDLLVPVMGWINCDYFANYDPSAVTTVSYISTDDNLEGVMKFLYFTEFESVMQVNGVESGNVPIGAHVKSVCFAMNSAGTMFYHLSEFDIAAGQPVNVTMVETTEAGLLALLSDL
ncbi:MAG: hypothetical protein ACI9FU_000073 [Granulosicoccus sp.]|jgi:hypothetical protein